MKTLWAKLVASKPVEAEAIVDVERLAAEGLRQLGSQLAAKEKAEAELRRAAVDQKHQLHLADQRTSAPGESLRSPKQSRSRNLSKTLATPHTPGV